MSSFPDDSPRLEIAEEEVTQGHLDELANRIQSLREAARQAKRQQAQVLRGQRLARSQRLYLAVAQTLRRATAAVFDWRWAGALIGTTILGGVFCIITQSWTGGLCGLALGAAAFACLFYLPSDATLPGNAEKVRSRLTELQSDGDQARRWLSDAMAQLQAVGERHRRLAELLKAKQHRESQQYRRQQLCARNWKALRSQDFERFLEEVFRELGYVVEMTRITGDQGADLLVSRHGHRIAIQVKGYLHSVGNDAVQEAYFGTVYYKCEACAVITNSRFTSGAKDAADKSGCVLIDEDRLPVLIMGHLDLWQLILVARKPPQPNSAARPQTGSR